MKLPRVASHCLHKILIIIIKGMLVISRAYHYSPRPLPDPRPTPSSRLALALGIARRPDPARAVAFTKAATAAAALARRRAGLPSPALPCSLPPSSRRRSLVATAAQPRRCPRPQREGRGGRLRRRLRRVRRIPARPRRPPVRGQPRGTNSPVIRSHDETSNPIT